MVACLRKRRVSCPCCGVEARRFPSYAGRRNALCPECGSLERHRLLCHLLFEDRPELLERASSLLHFAPEPCLGPRLRATPGLRYVSADVRPGRAAVTCDITDLPFEDASFDFVLCSHVLEHVEDERAALFELARVLCPGGNALILVPLDGDRAETCDDAGTAERRQPGHLRLYGLDFPRRLEAAGLAMSIDRYADQVEKRLVATHNMGSRGVYLCTKPA